MHAPTATILLVDDEPALLSLVKRALEAGGYEVLAAHNGLQALELCGDRKNHIDLLLTDINMPRMNGAELACSLAELMPDLPVMFMTGGRTGAPELEMLLQDGPFGDCRLIRKPFTPAELLQEVTRLIPARLSS
jgi:CheY-like chemotaxis protein